MTLADVVVMIFFIFAVGTAIYRILRRRKDNHCRNCSLCCYSKKKEGVTKAKRKTECMK